MSESGHRPTGDASGERYSLAALTAAAGVSVRTVRYYISEGLLPPPTGAGPGSHYTRAHLNRLMLIGRLKDAYLPLKEIRRRLTGLSDAEVAALVDEGVATTEAAPREDDALAYIDRVLGPARAGAAARAGDGGGRAASPKAIQEPASVWDRALAGPPVGATATGAAEADPIDNAEPWLRIRLGDEAELLVSDRLLRHRRDKVDWLVRWARRVLR